MIKNKMIRKYFLLAAVIVVLFVVLGFTTMNFVAQALRPERNQKDQMPPMFLAQVVDHMQSPSKLEALKEIRSWRQNEFSPEVRLLDHKGQVLFSDASLKDDPAPTVTAAELSSLKNPYDYIYVKNPADAGLRSPPPMPPGPFLMRPSPPMREFSRDIAVIRLQGEPAYYLLIHPPKFREARAMTTSEKLIPFFGMGSLLLSLLIGIGVTLFIIYISVFKRIKEADRVISEIQSGNLKSRFKIGRRDEFGEAMLRFNKMADEIENLVEQLKFAELARTKLLQELAHDLRTPIASMKSLLETLQSKGDRLDSHVRQEVISLSLRETKYFEVLIEDLLLLSQVSEPQYGIEQQKIVIKKLVIEEVEEQITHQKNKDHQIQFVQSIFETDFAIRGNELLFRRMLKNILNNAVSFAKTQIKVTLALDNQFLHLIFEDDGPGFTPEQLGSYGLRKMSRQVIQEKGREERLSIGLGAVIIKKISGLHRAELQVENVQDLQPHKTGARLHLKFAQT